MKQNGGHAQSRTRFWVMRDGMIVFDGTQSELEQADDPYVTKFMKPRMELYGYQG